MEKRREKLPRDRSFPPQKLPMQQKLWVAFPTHLVPLTTLVCPCDCSPQLPSELLLNLQSPPHKFPIRGCASQPPTIILSFVSQYQFLTHFYYDLSLYNTVDLCLSLTGVSLLWKENTSFMLKHCPATRPLPCAAPSTWSQGAFPQRSRLCSSLLGGASSKEPISKSIGSHTLVPHPAPLS